MRLWLRIALLFAAPPIIAVTLGLVGLQWQLRANLLSYARDVENQQVQVLAQRLAQFSRAEDGFGKLREQPRLWADLLVSAGITGSSMPSTSKVSTHERHPLAFYLAPRLSLWDANGAWVVGSRLPIDAPSVPILDNGHRLGELRYQRLSALSSEIDLAYIAAQRTTILRGAALVLTLSVIAAWVLTHRLLNPLRKLVIATKALGNGDFDTRVDIVRSDELGALANDFNRLASVLAHNRNAQRAWIADISHELRTPLTVLQAELQALQENVRPLTRAALDSLGEETQRLDQLIDDLYVLSTADTGALEYRFENLPLVEWLRAALDRFAPALTQAGLTATLNDGTAIARPILRGDGQRLGQVLDNLLANAIRYTDAGGRVEISVHAEPASWLIAIDDSAPGVADADLPRLFERLFRVESSRSRATGGAGLGLAICRSIVEGHGGKISARQSPLGGLGIDIRLPRGGASS